MFYERGVSRENFSHAGGMKGYLDRRPAVVLAVLTSVLPETEDHPAPTYSFLCSPGRHQAAEFRVEPPGSRPARATSWSSSRLLTDFACPAASPPSDFLT